MTALARKKSLSFTAGSRLGIWKPGRDVQQIDKVRNNGTLTAFVQGQKEYELSNHLGNVMATLSDTRSAIATASGTTVDHYEAVVLSARDYYPFGMQLPGRNRTDGSSGTIDNPPPSGAGLLALALASRPVPSCHLC